MTWIVGTPTLFGHAILVSDICVTFRSEDGSTHFQDCLQKIYRVGKSQLAGFSGSVTIGFKIIHQLIYESSKLPANQDWIVDVVANTWLPRLIRRIFTDSSEEEKKLGCTIILASAHPDKNMGDATWPITNIHVFRSPNFSTERIDPGYPAKVVSIGSGSSVDFYQSELKSATATFDFQQAAVGLGPHGQALYLTKVINKAAEDHPIAGVSKLFQIGIVTRKRYIIKDNEYKVFPQDGPDIEVKLPPIATNYNEFLECCKEIGKSAESAEC